MTKGFASYAVSNGMQCHNNGGMAVIGKFVCDFILDIYPPFGNKTEGTCLTAREMHEYSAGKQLYGWHISDLVIYDTPKGVSEFYSICKEYRKGNPNCGGCDYYHSMGEYPAECDCDGAKYLYRPPQSWCYAEEGAD